jgi:hypothetical protein
MSIAFSCACGRNLRAGPHLAGKKTKCPGCGAVLTIPAESEEAAPAVAPAPAPRPKTAPAAAQVTAPVASSVTCTCGKRIATKPEWAGKTIKCPACENRIKVPAAASPVVPAAAAAKPAPAQRPAPPPIEDDDPFGDNGTGADEEGAGSGGYQPFNDEDSGDDDDVPAPPRGKGRSNPAAPAKKGGSRVLFFSIVGVLLIALCGAGVLFMFPSLLNPPPPPPLKAPVISAKQDPDEKDDPDDVAPDAKKGKPKAAAKDLTKDPDDPDVPTDPKTTIAPKVNPKATVPDLPDLPVPPSETPGKKKEAKKTTPPGIDVPKFGPAPPKIKLDPEPEAPNDPKSAPDKKTVFDYVPGDAISFAVVRVGAFLDSPSGAKVIEMAGPGYGMFVKGMEAKVGIEPKDIRTILVVATSVPTDPKKAQESGIVLVETAMPIDFSRLEKEADVKQEVAGKKMLFKNDDPVGVLLLSPTRAVGGTKEMVSALLAGAPKAGALSASLKEAAASKAIVFMAFQTTPELAKLRDGGLDSIGKSFPPAADIGNAAAGQLTISEDKSLKVSLKLTYPDADKAGKSKKALEELVEQGSALLTLGKKNIEALPQGAKLAALGKSALASVKLSLEGETLTVPLEIDATIGDLAEIGMSVVPMMMMGGGPPRVPPPAPKQIEKK